MTVDSIFNKIKARYNRMRKMNNRFFKQEIARRMIMQMGEFTYHFEQFLNERQCRHLDRMKSHCWNLFEGRRNG